MEGDYYSRDGDREEDQGVEVEGAGGGDWGAGGTAAVKGSSLFFAMFNFFLQNFSVLPYRP